MVQLLLRAGANRQWYLTIHIASQRGSLETTFLLRSAGAAVDSTDTYGFETVHLA